MSSNNKRVLITGGAGFIGSNLAMRLVAEGARVTVVDSMVEGTGCNVFNLDSIREKIDFQKTDLRDAEKLVAVVRGQDWIFNLAGNVSHQDSMSVPLNDLELNVRAQLTLLEACRKNCPSAVIVFGGTRQIYGTPQYLPVDESHPINPLDINGINKLAAEQYHSLYAKVYGLKTVSLRLTNTYGPRQLISHARQGFIGWFVNRAITGNRIQLFGDGKQVRDFNYVDDVVEALIRAAEVQTCHGGIYNLSGERASLATIGGRLLEITGGGSIETMPFPEDRKKIDIGDYYGTSERFTEATGWRPTIGIGEGLKKTIEYFRIHQEHYLKD